MRFRVSVHRLSGRQRVRHQDLAGCVRAAARWEGIRSGAVRIVLVGSRDSRRMNRRFLRHDYVTDVLAFDLSDDENLDGEIYVNVERAAVQARVYAVPFRNEMTRLVVHGFLHLTGHDDHAPKGARAMHAVQEMYLDRWWSRRTTRST